ncbi:LysM peptidoglycan-binding domain-containing protein [Thiohalorhabdus sp. Cl-TMA]|uniref:LysM peptidoglycan-binding domain-containing protein n=1 Tax=Thiohalorhabdus methylotrophus TaxID=3242694 RepID=A0ABV4TTC2_9GAMM
MRTLAFIGISLFMTGCAQMHGTAADTSTSADTADAADTRADKTAGGTDQEQTGKADSKPALAMRLPSLIEDDIAFRPQASGDAIRTAAEQIAEDKEPAEEFWGYFLPRLQLETTEHHQVQAFIRFYRTHENYLNRVFNRGKPFLPHILGRLEEEDMPLDLALLPVVESAFRPFAYSSGRAAGIWQFTPATGRHFDLEQNWWYDGRRDILAATDAAVEYLKRLNDRFDSWLLALAAYNSGPGTVSRAIRENERRGQPTDFWHLDLPRETRGYVPKLLALSHVVRNTDEYGINLPDIPMKPGFQVVNLDKPIDLARAADLSGSEVETLYRLNPGLNQWCTPPDGPGRLVLPLGTKEQFKEALAELDPSERVRWARHRIDRGETLSEIASEYRTTVSVLKRVNNLSGSRITAGKHLVIPTASGSEQKYALSRSQRLAAIRSDGPSGRSKVIHRVRRGESLWEISRRFNVKMNLLAKWNGMAPGDTLREGQKLAVWVSGGDVSSSNSRSARLRYRVRQGDSLWSISRKFNVALHRLRNWNDLAQDELIHPGDKLTIYVDPTKLAEHRG